MLYYTMLLIIIIYFGILHDSIFLCDMVGIISHNNISFHGYMHVYIYIYIYAYVHKYSSE